MQVADVTSELTDLETFWTEKKRDEALKIVKDGLNRARGA